MIPIAYQELIKNFSRIRDYMRQFYVYGFRNRSEYRQKSARSYDNERRRIESWMGDYMSFRQDESGKAVFLEKFTISHSVVNVKFCGNYIMTLTCRDATCRVLVFAFPLQYAARRVPTFIQAPW